MLWENICGRGCGELSCTAWTHGLGLQVGGLGVGGCVCGGEQASGRCTSRGGGSGFKKAEPGVWWAAWCMFFPPLFPLVFSARTLRSVDVDAMSADRVQEALACLF